LVYFVTKKLSVSLCVFVRRFTDTTDHHLIMNIKHTSDNASRDIDPRQYMHEWRWNDHGFQTLHYTSLLGHPWKPSKQSIKDTYLCGRTRLAYSWDQLQLAETAGKGERKACGCWWCEWNLLVRLKSKQEERRDGKSRKVVGVDEVKWMKGCDIRIGWCIIPYPLMNCQGILFLGIVY
jgi:hypothetical protein